MNHENRFKKIYFGIAVVTYESDSYLQDYISVRNFLFNNADDLNIKKDKIGIFAFCGSLNHFYKMQLNLPNQSTLKLECGIFFSGTLLPPKKYAPKYPVLLVDAGKDYKVCKKSFDIFKNQAHHYGIEFEVIDYADGVHRFDIKQNTDESKAVCKRSVGCFARETLWVLKTKASNYQSGKPLGSERLRQSLSK